MRRFDGQPVCYVIQPSNGGPFKVGYSVGVYDRLQTLQTSQAYTLTVRLLLDGGRPTERILHAILRNYRLHGEWFQPEATSLLNASLDRFTTLYGQPWDASHYKTTGPTVGELRQSMRDALATALPKVIAWAHDPNDPSSDDATRLLLRYATPSDVIHIKN